MSGISQVLADVSQAQSIGLDAFALNVQQPSAWWTHATLSLLFDAASQAGFKLFFSMDMSVTPSPLDCLSPSTQGIHLAPGLRPLPKTGPFSAHFRGGASPNAATEWPAFFHALGSNPPLYVISNFGNFPPMQQSQTLIFPSSILTAFPS